MYNQTEEALHILQHQLLPDLFYQGGAGFVELLREEEPNLLFQVFSELMAKYGYLPPYGPEEFERSMILLTAEEVPEHLREFAFIVTWPEPTAPLLCHRSYLLCDATCRHQGYFTVERMKNNGLPCLYGWNPDHTHQFFGIVSRNEGYQLKKVAEMYCQTLAAAQLF